MGLPASSTLWTPSRTAGSLQTQCLNGEQVGSRLPGHGHPWSRVSWPWVSRGVAGSPPEFFKQALRHQTSVRFFSPRRPCRRQSRGRERFVMSKDQGHRGTRNASKNNCSEINTTSSFCHRAMMANSLASTHGRSGPRIAGKPHDRGACSHIACHVSWPLCPQSNGVLPPCHTVFLLGAHTLQHKRHAAQLHPATQARLAAQAHLCNHKRLQHQGITAVSRTGSISSMWYPSSR
jgi:hypothetical protein